MNKDQRSLSIAEQMALMSGAKRVGGRNEGKNVMLKNITDGNGVTIINCDEIVVVGGDATYQNVCFKIFEEDMPKFSKDIAKMKKFIKAYGQTNERNKKFKILRNEDSEFLHFLEIRNCVEMLSKNKKYFEYKIDTETELKHSQGKRES